MKKCKLTCFIIAFVMAYISLFNFKTVKASIDFVINKNNGDIEWKSMAGIASTGIRWQIKGYYLSLEPSKNLGYPLERTSPMIKLYVNKHTVKATHIGKEGDNYIVNNVLLGKYVKKQIISNSRFYSEMIKKYKKGDKYLYLDTFFETYSVVSDLNIKTKVIAAYRLKKEADFFKPEGKYIYVNGEKYDYDSQKNIVKKIRKNDLTDIIKIKNAEQWNEEAKKQWLNHDYYNHKFVYDIYSNVIVKYVDENGFLIGKKKAGIKLNNSVVKEVLDNGNKINNPHYEYKNGEKYLGDDVKIIFPKKLIVTKNNKKIKYKLKASEQYAEEGAIDPKHHQSGDKAAVQKLTLGADNAVVVGIYKRKNGIPKEDEDEMSNELEEPEPIGVIESGTLDNSPFDIVDGIPTDEYYYKNVVTEEYLLKYRFKNKSGEKLYKVRSYITWHLSWVTGKGKNAVVHKAIKKRDYITQIKRKYSYWYIDNLEVYTLDGAILYNQALPDSGVKMIPKGYIRPKIECIADTLENKHLKPPPESLKIINLGTKHINASNIPPYNPKKEIEAAVGDVLVKNDSLSINGKVIMDGKEVRKKTAVPVEAEAKGKKTEKKVLYEFGNKIERTTQNDVYDSSGKVIYVLTKSINPEDGDNLEFDIEGINPVTVHTPVICDYNIADAKNWCQLIKPDKSLYQLVLEKGFDIDVLTTGKHLDIKGYGYRDYAKYVLKKEIIFPFDVLADGRLCHANEPVEVSGNTHFHLPMTVDEGKYVILVRTYAINCLNQQSAEDYANLSRENYAAENRIGVEVSGRLIDFTLKNVKNTKIWQNNNGEFVLGGGAKLDKLPLIEGDNPNFKNEGAFKKGYAVKYAMTTIGNYYDEIYGIRLDFDFHVINNVTAERTAVDIYYEEVSEKDDRMLGLIKIGSKKDKNNVHCVKNGDKEIGLFRYDRALLPKQLLAVGSNRYIQRWEGEYSLPERIYVCEKGFNLETYMKKHMSINFDEKFWIKSGQLIVSADISAMKGGEKILSYINDKNEAEGYFNNWKYETAGRRKYSTGGREFKFIDGDLFAYDLSKKIWEERRAEVKKVY